MIIQMYIKPSLFIQIQESYLNMWFPKQVLSSLDQKSYYKDHIIDFITYNC